MNRQLQIDDFLLAAHRLAGERLRADPQRIGMARALLARRERRDALRPFPASASQPRLDRLDRQRFAVESIRAWARRRTAEATTA